MFTLIICLTTANLPWFMNLTFQVPMQYFSLQHQALLLSPVTSTTVCCFSLAPSLQSPGVISPLISRAYWAPTDLGSSSFSVLSFSFSYCSWGSQGEHTEVVCHSLLQWTTFSQTSLPWPVCLGWSHMAWLGFTELDKAVVCVIRLACCLWLWFQSAWPLMPSLSAYRLSWVSLIQLQASKN